MGFVVGTEFLFYFELVRTITPILDSGLRLA